MQLAEVAEGRRFLLQGGDCAERFADCAARPIEAKLRILLQMSLVLTWGARIPTLRIGRMAGQFAKPRSSPHETVDGKRVPSYKGDNINSFDTSARTPDPHRLVDGYFHSAATLNYARSLLTSDFADLRSARRWDLGFVQDQALRQHYQQMVDRILGSLDFLRAASGAGGDAEAFRSADFFTSHEGMHLAYEQSLTRPYKGGVEPVAQLEAAPVPRPPTEADEAAAAGSAQRPRAISAASLSDDCKKDWYNVGAHFLWIGDRTRHLNHAHVEYFRGLENPIGIKIGPSMKPGELVPLIRRLWADPEGDPGKIVLITRLGASKVKELLPGFVREVKSTGLRVVWICDPMHGNTKKTAADHGGLKTREFDDIVSELRQSFEVHEALDSLLGGVHFELTGENVTECTGGPEGLGPADLPRRYMTYCDPRLNYAQSMELAFLIARHLQRTRKPCVDLAGAEAERPVTPSLVKTAWDRAGGAAAAARQHAVGGKRRDRPVAPEGDEAGGRGAKQRPAAE